MNKYIFSLADVFYVGGQIRVILHSGKYGMLRSQSKLEVHRFSKSLKATSKFEALDFSLYYCFPQAL